jgi:hypothetical protein
MAGSCLTRAPPVVRRPAGDRMPQRRDIVGRTHARLFRLKSDGHVATTRVTLAEDIAQAYGGQLRAPVRISQPLALSHWMAQRQPQPKRHSGPGASGGRSD